jgi:hypothetical protein
MAGGGMGLSRLMVSRWLLVLTLATATAIAGSRAQPASPDVPSPVPTVAMPGPETLLMLVRTTLVALNQANFTGNYTVLHGLASPALQQRHSPAALSDAFASLRAQNLDLSPVLVLSPQLTKGPQLQSGDMLSFAGFFPTQPFRIEFEMAFVPVDGRWRIDSLAVSIPSSSPDSPADSTKQ